MIDLLTHGHGVVSMRGQPGTTGGYYHRGPYRNKITAILLLTDKDHRDQQHYRIAPHREWRKLVTQADYDALNQAVKSMAGSLHKSGNAQVVPSSTILSY